MSSMNQVDIVASFQTSYFISGIAPFGDSLVVLAYIPWKKTERRTSVVLFLHASYAGGQWAAGDEPLYYIVSPKDVVIAKPRDTEDHISWLLQHGWHEKALAAVEAGQGRSELIDEVGSRYLDHLIVERKYAEAASLCPKLLRGSAAAWERWVFHFAHLRQLPVLVPYIPTENPRLRDTAYEVALVALATNTSFHKDLLTIVKTWPPVIYSSLPVISAIEPQLNTSSSTDALKEVSAWEYYLIPAFILLTSYKVLLSCQALAELYVIDGQYEKAFGLYADLKKPDIFDFIDKHNLHDSIREKVAQLMMIDCKRAIPLFIQHRDLISPSDVVSQFIAAKNKCDYRYFLHQYLHSLFESNPHAGRDFHDMQVELYADYDPKMLLPFLRSSQHYTLEKAIEFVSMQHDDELWEELIKQCLNKPEMVGVLLEHTVGNLDPLYIVNMVPNGLEIPRLRDRLVKIITDYRTETSLRHGCNDILKADCVNLLIKYYKEARRAIYLSNEEDESRTKRDNKNKQSQLTERSMSIRNMEVKPKIRSGTRCCMCFDPFSIQDVSIYIFFCCHAYHETCLMDSIDSISSKKKPAASSNQDDLSILYPIRIN
ncbi:hypothetical protein DH2020_021129 [Rehmannia glutinosa]|uniref:Vps41 C-terminal RING finger domain-containing protein n=1 Tax=Rehmannia glutinosa TaxID=99300 RepID=A0ABR0WB62_REHGL